MTFIRRFVRALFTTRRGRVALGGLIAMAIPALLVAGWLIRPLFVDTVVDEAFPLSADAFVPEGITHDEARVMMSTAAKLEATVDEAMPAAMMAGAEAIKRGEFVGGDRFHQGRGSATIYRLADGAYVLRFEDFEVTNGPDLRVLVSPHPNPRGSGDVTAEGYVELGKLKGNIGPQNYLFPEGLTPDEFQSVVIYCKPFHVVFSVAALSEN